MELNYELIEYVRNFLHNSAFFDDLLPRYDEIIENIGDILKEKIKQFSILCTEDTEELLDYLDGNGFELDYKSETLSFRSSTHFIYVLVKPQYPLYTYSEATVFISSNGWV